jgi:hypothetical protein
MVPTVTSQYRLLILVTQYSGWMELITPTIQSLNLGNNY